MKKKRKEIIEILKTIKSDVNLFDEDFIQKQIKIEMEREKALKKERNRWRDWYQRNREKRKVYRQKPENLKKNKAREKTNALIRQGKLKRLPCEVCGYPKSQAHHVHYGRPLDIMWLCYQDHWKLHRKMKISRL